MSCPQPSQQNFRDRNEQEGHVKEEHIGSPLSSDSESVILHESWPSRPQKSAPPYQQPMRPSNQPKDASDQQITSHQQFASNWPLASIAMAHQLPQHVQGDHGPRSQPPPRNNSLVAPMETPPVQVHHHVQQPEPCARIDRIDGAGESAGPPAEASRGMRQQPKQSNKDQEVETIVSQLSLALRRVSRRPSSFEIIGCVTPRNFRHGQPTSATGKDASAGNESFQTGHFDSSQMTAEDGQPVSQLPEHQWHGPAVDVVQQECGGSHGAGVGAIRPRCGVRLGHRQCETRDSLVLVVTVFSISVSAFSLTASVSVTVVFTQMGKSVQTGYVVWCIISLTIFVLSSAGLIFCLVGVDHPIFPYKLQSPFVRLPLRRLSAQQREFELHEMQRERRTTDRDVESEAARGNSTSQRSRVVPMPVHCRYNLGAARPVGAGRMSRTASTKSNVPLYPGRPRSDTSMSTLPPTPPPKPKISLCIPSPISRSALLGRGPSATVAGPNNMALAVAESKEQLLRNAASNATMPPSHTQASILTELCDAVTTPDATDQNSPLAATSYPEVAASRCDRPTPAPNPSYPRKLS